MVRRIWMVLTLVVASAVVLALPGLAVGAEADDQAAVKEAATEYLSTRAAAIVSEASRGDLMKLFAPGAAQSRVEALMALGATKSHEATKSVPRETTCTVDIKSVTVSGESATVVAYAEVLTYFTADSLRKDYQGDGLLHTISLVLKNGKWLVAADDYASDTAVAYLSKAGASASLIARTRRKMIAKLTVSASDQAGAVVAEPMAVSQALPQVRKSAVQYTVHLNRARVQKYADKYWSSYNPRYVSFSKDCANFVSQAVHCDSYPDDGTSGVGFWYYNGSYPWWYSNSTSYPYSSESWRFCPTMVTSWKTRATGVPTLGTKFIKTWTSSCPGNWGTDWRRGDCMWWDFSDGSPWYADHVAVVVDFANGKSLVDAHTTNHRHIAAGDIGTVGRRYGHLYNDIIYTYK